MTNDNNRDSVVDSEELLPRNKVQAKFSNSPAYRAAHEIWAWAFARGYPVNDEHLEWLTGIITKYTATDTAVSPDALCAYHGQRLIEWMDDPNRKPANEAFTAGNERQIAYRFERACAVSPSDGDVEAQAQQIIDSCLAPHESGYKNLKAAIITALKSTFSAGRAKGIEEAIEAVQSVAHGTRFHAASAMGRDRELNGRIQGVEECLTALRALD